ncbi:MAG: DNA polymerase III subunit gamma/tau [Oscillospiraceae bacterium]|nr:DNA polymerase III subunit gamma/tau [Oscillospiraceae bacterium]
MYQALYRKWRPQDFDSVIGQSHITDILKNQLATGRTSHAYLFTGTRGTGKTTCAKILAKALNCEHLKNGNPCGECFSCKGIDNGSIFDVVELDAASNNGVENVRALRDEAIYSPAAVKKRVYIIDEVHMLSTSAFNALLKILEEPPEHLVFILATTELHKVPATILSRCQRFAFRRINRDDITAQLKKIAAADNIALADDAAELLARLADGALRDALSLLDQCAAGGDVDLQRVYAVLGVSGSRRTEQVLASILKGDAATALRALDSFLKEGGRASSMIEELAVLVRDILLRRIAPREGKELLSGAHDDKTLSRFASVGTEKLVGMLELLTNASAEMSRDGGRTAAELCLIKLCGFRAALPSVSPAPAQAENAPEYADAPAPSDDEVPPAPSDDDAPPPPAAEPIREAPAEPAPAAASAAPSGNSETELWSRVLADIENKIDVPLFILLSDSMEISAQLVSDTLTVSAANPFSLAMIDKSDLAAVIRASATALSGRPIAVKFALGAPAKRELREDKLDKLSAFKNVTIT